MHRRLTAALITTLLAAVGLTPATAAAQTADAPQLRISVSPAVITSGQTSKVCVRSLADEQVTLFAYTSPSTTYVPVRTGSSSSTLTCWDVRPGADTRLLAAVTDRSRDSPSAVIQVRRTAVATGTYSAPLRTAVRALPVAAENNAGYDRDRFFGGDWVDADQDCQDTRHEVLIAESLVPPAYTSRRCTVTTGRWVPFYDGRTYTQASQLQIDHLVPVAEAWGSGARSWTQARRVAFYNDLGVGYALNAMPSALNQSKQASGPETWMPPANRCRYIEVWTAMKIRWQLSVDPTERAALVRYADGCANRAVTVSRA